MQLWPPSSAATAPMRQLARRWSFVVCPLCSLRGFLVFRVCSFISLLGFCVVAKRNSPSGALRRQGLSSSKGLPSFRPRCAQHSTKKVAIAVVRTAQQCSFFQRPLRVRVGDRPRIRFLPLPFLSPFSFPDSHVCTFVCRYVRSCFGDNFAV